MARSLAELWGTLPSSGFFVDGAAIRELGAGAWVLRRPGLHIRDERMDDRLPVELRTGRVLLVFASVHWSEAGPRCFTVHPLGNLGDSDQVGGRPRTLVPAAPAWMTGALRALSELAPSVARTACFEATHHGPSLGLPAFFIEIGGGTAPGEPSADELSVLSRVLQQLRPTEGDRVAVGVGGGHYAPHFTDLALRRCWSFGHLVPRHFVENIDPETARSAVAVTPGCEGIVFARAADAQLPSWRDLTTRLRDQDAAPRAAAPRTG
ncbi:MAG TPA: D-aminoacyl-tRNA deacylase [Thermoplasmata archaeon]|nr:D-aminoacyl-tRNA deacylase [Thermoplasmata archaeon]